MNNESFDTMVENFYKERKEAFYESLRREQTFKVLFKDMFKETFEFDIKGCSNEDLLNITNFCNKHVKIKEEYLEV